MQQIDCEFVQDSVFLDRICTHFLAMRNDPSLEHRSIASTALSEDTNHKHKQQQPRCCLPDTSSKKGHPSRLSHRHPHTKPQQHAAQSKSEIEPHRTSASAWDGLVSHTVKPDKTWVAYWKLKLDLLPKQQYPIDQSLHHRNSGAWSTRKLHDCAASLLSTRSGSHLVQQLSDCGHEWRRHSSRNKLTKPTMLRQRNLVYTVASHKFSPVRNYFIITLMIRDGCHACRWMVSS